VSRGRSFVDAHSCPWYPKTSPQPAEFLRFRRRALTRAYGGNVRSPEHWGWAVDRFLDEAALVGQGRKFQIWEPNRFAAHFEEAKARVRRLRAKSASA
jgi:hypothetical protein